MRIDKISESGLIGADGKLHLPMDRINAFCAQQKGKRVIARFEAVAPGSTDAQQSYYYGYILPTIQTALMDTGTRYNEKKTDEFLMLQYPGDRVRIDGTLAEYGRDLNQTQMSDFIDWIKQFAAEPPLSVYVEDAQTI